MSTSESSNGDTPVTQHDAPVPAVAPAVKRSRSKRIRREALIVAVAAVFVGIMLMARRQATVLAPSAQTESDAPRNASTSQPTQSAAITASNSPVAGDAPLVSQPRAPRTAVESARRSPQAVVKKQAPKEAGRGLVEVDVPAAHALPAAAVDPQPPLTVAANEPDSKSEAAPQEPVSITGCLETSVEEDRFRLTDTVGADAPKARSWRSAFLKKHSAPVELVEVSDRSALRQYVGHRVVATGLLTSRELRVRSLQPAGTACN